MADKLAANLKDKQFDKFRQSIRKQSNGKAAAKVNTVAGCVGDAAISDMWKKHFDSLYHSVNDDGSKQAFLQRMSELNKQHGRYVTTVRDIAVHCSQQEKAKSVGPDAVPMECFIFGGTRLYIHLSILFNCFIRYGYLPKPFMQSLIIPLLKVKSGNVTDEDNYRAIAVSTAVSKIFECVIADEIVNVSDNDMYQFGFKKGHSTGLCTNILKHTEIITLLMEVMCSYAV